MNDLGGEGATKAVAARLTTSTKHTDGVTQIVLGFVHIEWGLKFMVSNKKVHF